MGKVSDAELGALLRKIDLRLDQIVTAQTLVDEERFSVVHLLRDMAGHLNPFDPDVWEALSDASDRIAERVGEKVQTVRQNPWEWPQVMRQSTGASSPANVLTFTLDEIRKGAKLGQSPFDPNPDSDAYHGRIAACRIVERIVETDWLSWRGTKPSMEEMCVVFSRAIKIAQLGG